MRPPSRRGRLRPLANSRARFSISANQAESRSGPGWILEAVESGRGPSGLAHSPGVPTLPHATSECSSFDSTPDPVLAPPRGRRRIPDRRGATCRREAVQGCRLCVTALTDRRSADRPFWASLLTRVDGESEAVAHVDSLIVGADQESYLQPIATATNRCSGQLQVPGQHGAAVDGHLDGATQDVVRLAPGTDPHETIRKSTERSRAVR